MTAKKSNAGRPTIFDRSMIDKAKEYVLFFITTKPEDLENHTEVIPTIAGTCGVILCAREHLNSLADSSMEEIKQAIRSVPFLNDYYDLGENYIRTKNRNIEYVFSGLRHNLDSIKSKARILICWIDEAENVSEVAYRKLLPTVREEGSQLYITYNPEKRGSPTDIRFNHPEILDGDGNVIGMCVEMNYMDNPWFPAVLDLERKRDKRNLDDATYRWIGKPSELYRIKSFLCYKLWQWRLYTNRQYHYLWFTNRED